MNSIHIRNSWRGDPIIEFLDDEGALTFTVTEEGGDFVDLWVDPVAGIAQINLPEGSIDRMTKAYRRHVKAQRKAGRVGY